MSADEAMPGSAFRILAIDGGGLRGMFAASFLATVEEMHGPDLVRHFDLLAGTSTGAIIALGLASGLSARDLAGFYRKEGPRVFPRDLRRFGRWAFGPKYDPVPLRSALTNAFGTATLGTLKSSVIVPAYNAATGDVRVFKTPHAPRVKLDHAASIVDVALASTAAPTYLSGHKTDAQERFVDGGVWANNPAAIAILEAVCVLGRPLDSVRVLSIGAPSSPSHISLATMTGGIVRWLLHGVSRMLFEAQDAGSLAMSKLLVRDRLLRVEPRVEAGRFSLDDPSGIPDLEALGIESARHLFDDVRARFLPSSETI